MNRQIRDLIYLASCVLNGESPDRKRVQKMDLEALYDTAAEQRMVSITAYAIRESGVEAPRFAKQRMTTWVRNRTVDREREAVLASLEEAGIWYMPLKGVVIREYYPQSDLREMSDNDIMFDPSRAADVKKIMEEHGFTTIHYGTGHQDDYQKEPVCHFEMHRMLFTTEAPPQIYSYYQKIENKLLPGKGFAKHFSNEDFYIFLVAHEYKHYYWHGIGLKALIDIYVFLSKFGMQMDWKYLRREMKKLGIKDFEKRNRLLAMTVFSKDGLKKLTSAQKRMLKVFVTGGDFRIWDYDRHTAEMIEQGKAGYILRRILLPLPDVKESYPFFYEHRQFLPLLPAYRLIRQSTNAAAELRKILKV